MKSVQSGAWSAESCYPIISVYHYLVLLSTLLTLSQDKRLGLIVEPIEVRMHPRASDGYKWSILPQSQYLFRQNLSKLTTRTYQQIIQCIGTSVEVVRNDSSSSEEAVNNDTCNNPSSDSGVYRYTRIILKYLTTF